PQASNSIAAAPTDVPTDVPTEVPPTVAPTPTLGPSLLQLGNTAFQFEDPPEPGATAHLTVTVHNPTDQPGGPVSLFLPMEWLNGYRVDSADPKPLEQRREDANLRITFDGPEANADEDLQVTVVTTAEVIDAPALRVVDAEGREVGTAKPNTEAPP